MLEAVICGEKFNDENYKSDSFDHVHQFWVRNVEIEFHHEKRQVETHYAEKYAREDLKVQFSQVKYD